MQEFLTTLSNVFTFAFVVTSMLSMGLGLTIPQIIEPLKNTRLVILALVANFLIVPATAFVVTQIIPMDSDLKIGLIIFGCAAGAPFLPKMAQIAKSNLAFAVGLMTLLMVITVIYLPIVMPLLLPGVTVDAGSIAASLIIEMLIPLGIGLFIKARYDEAAKNLMPTFNQISSVCLVLLLVLMLGLNINQVIGLLGSGSILGILIVLLVAVAAGYFLGGPNGDTREVLGLGTGQRNLAATFVVAGGSFAAQPNVLVLLAAAGLVGMVILMPLAAEFGKRKAGAAIPPAPAADTTQGGV